MAITFTKAVKRTPLGQTQRGHPLQRKESQDGDEYREAGQINARLQGWRKYKEGTSKQILAGLRRKQRGHPDKHKTTSLETDTERGRHCRGGHRALHTVCFLTFPLKALLSQEADYGEELGDLLQVHHSGVIQTDDGHGVFVVRRADSWILLGQARGRE